MSDPVSAPSSSPLHALLEKWRKQVKHSAYYIRFYKDQQDLEGTETPLVLASEALAFADELEATLTAAPQTPEKDNKAWEIESGHGGPKSGSYHDLVEAQAGPSDPDPKATAALESFIAAGEKLREVVKGPSDPEKERK